MRHPRFSHSCQVADLQYFVRVLQKGDLDWLPNVAFVLDKYHKNKAIKAMTAGLDKKTRKAFNQEIRTALADEDTIFHPAFYRIR